MQSFIFISLLFLIPVGIIFSCQKSAKLDKIGVVVLAFATGIILNTLFDLSAIFSDTDLINIQTTLSEVAIALALPLIIFTIDVKKSLNMAGDTLKSMGVALLAVMVVSAIGAVIFKDQLEDIWQIAGMSVGAYTGGGPNMAAIKTAIDADQDLFITMTTYDILLSAIFLMFVMTIAKPIFSRFLKPYASNLSTNDNDHNDMFDHMADESANSYKALIQKNSIAKTFFALIISGACVGSAVAISSLFPSSMSSAVTIISITTLGLLASFVPFVRTLKTSFQLGMFLILVFCFTMGTMTDTSIFTNLNFDLFFYIGFILLGSMIIQALICRFLKIDTDTFLITSSAAIMSVPFIPVIAGALKNRDIIIPGFAAAIIGYVVGNYLGVLVAFGTQYLIG